MHGSIHGAVCLRCGASAGFERVLKLLPLPVCACGEILKPAVVMFGELMPVAAFERATELSRAAGLLLVVGSSLGGRAAHGPLVENPVAVGADALLDLVRDPGVLAQRVRDYGLVLVELAGSAFVPRCHLTPQRTHRDV